METASRPSTGPAFSGKRPDTAGQRRAPQPPQPIEGTDLHRNVAHWQTSYPWLAGVRIWSPAIVLPVVGLLFFFTAQPSTGRVTPSIWHSTLIRLLLYFGVGALYSLALHFAPSLNSWAKVLLGGMVLYSLVTLWLTGNVLLIILVVLIWLVLGFLYLRTSRHEIPADTLSHTTLGGRYWRTAVSGRIWLLPGERIRAQVPNPLKHYVASWQQMRLCAPTGENFNAEASISVSYRQLPTDALDKQIPLANREAHLQHMVNETVQNLLASYGTAALSKRMIGPHTPQPIKGHKLARTLLAQLRHNARSQRLAIGTVRIRGLQLIYCPGSGKLWHLQTPSSPAGQMDDADEPEAVEQESYHAPPVQTLLRLYQAVRDKTITDPTSIRTIAQAFRIAAQEEDQRNDGSADLEAVAQLLFKYAATLDNKGRALLRQQ